MRLDRGRDHAARQRVGERGRDRRPVGVELALAQLADHARQPLIVLAALEGARVHLPLQMLQLLHQSLHRHRRHIPGLLVSGRRGTYSPDRAGAPPRAGRGPAPTLHAGRTPSPRCPKGAPMVTRPSLPGLLAAVWIAAAPWVAPRRAAAQSPQFFLVVHGGAGTIRRADMTPSQDSAYRATLALAIRTGYDVLRADGAALDAVIATITVLEDSPLFNAGRGAVLTDAGTVELDAAVMDGTALRAGAVAGVKHIKNPIQLARLVMERSPHVLLAGDGAEAFARQQGMALVPQSYFVTERRRRELERARAREPQPHGGGTVGAVALDRQGRMAAGTYTNATCAVSGTGTGEYFIRNVVAYDICARVRYTGVSLAQAADTVVLHELVAQGGDGGVIALDRAGHFAMPFNTEGMYRGYVGPDGKIVVKIYRDE